MKITLVIASLGCGGAERVAATIANEWAVCGEQVSIVTFEEKDKAPFYGLKPSVKLVNLECNRPGSGIFAKFSFNLKKIKLLRRALIGSSPDVVISFMGQTNVSSILASFKTGIPVIITEHIDNRMYSFGAVWDVLMRLLYPFAAALVAVSRGVLESFPAYIRKNGTVIYNPITVVPPEPSVREERTERKLIGMGRLTGQKGFDLFLKAFAIVSEKNPAWNVEIWGEGECRTELEALKKKLGLEGRVNFPGLTAAPYKQFRESDIFVLSSRYEGLGIVLCEAMSQGLPAISFACPSGPAEIIRDGVDGILVAPEDIKALGEAMDRLMNDDAARKRMALRARKVAERFGTAAIIPRWNELILKLMGA